MKKDPPLISVIATCYNHSKYVKTCLDSINRQTYSNIELIVIDAKSTDNSVEIIDQWLKGCNHPFKFIRQPDTYGICKNINCGLQIVKGEFVQVIACDDYLDVNKFEFYINTYQNLPMSKDEIAMLFSGIGKVNEQGQVYEFKDSIVPIKSNLSYFENLLENNFIYAPSALISKKCLDDIGWYNEDLYYNDWDMWLRLSSKNQIYFINEYCSAFYRKIKTSMTYNKPIEYYASTFTIFYNFYIIGSNRNIIKKKLRGAIINWFYVKGRILGRLSLIITFIAPSLSFKLFNFFIARNIKRD